MKIQRFVAVSVMLAAPLFLTPRRTRAQDLPRPAAAQDPQTSPSPGSPSSSGHDEGPVRNWGPRHDWEHRDRPCPERGLDHDRGPEYSNALLPFGMWWKNPEVVTRVGLAPDQQKRIMDLFIQSRVKLITLHATLQEEQLLLEPLLDASPMEDAKTFAQIDKIADTRADLEKTNARMLLNIRGVLTPEQWTKLRSHPRGPRDGNDMRPQDPPRSN